MTELFDFAAHAAIQTNEQRIVSALERIEALLIKHFDGDADRPYTGEDITTVIEKIEPTKTPFMKAAAKGRK
jgi:hypothetical protein